MKFININNCIVDPNVWEMVKYGSNNIFANQAINGEPLSDVKEDQFIVIYSLE